MPTYQYTARDQRGQQVRGAQAASSVEALADALRRRGYLVTTHQEVGAFAVNAARGLQLFGPRVGYDDLVLLNVQLSKMVQVGIPLVTGLETLEQQATNPALKTTLADVARRVQGGESFSDALSHHGRIFSGLFINMVRAGEASGKLDDILRRLADFTKHQAQLREQLVTAMTYPIALLAVGIGVGTFLITMIIPKFMKIYLEADVPLPLPTLLLYQLSRHWWLIIGLLIAAVALLGWYVTTPAGRRQLDALSLRVPVLGELVRRAALSRFARTLATLISSGVPILESLAIAELTCGNAVIADACRAAASHVKEGGSLAEPLNASREFPPMVIQMILVGEAAGTLDQMLEEVANHYDELVQHGIKRVMSLVEPMFLVVMGGMVAFIMASLLLPMFRLVNVVK
ncbi:MAG: type II secretion system F family protein [Candidatus Omnitrophica bacterium]|nr:type II secretion system F family protein [Candidatus Omnitrophota bacterium]